MLEVNHTGRHISYRLKKKKKKVWGMHLEILVLNAFMSKGTL